MPIHGWSDDSLQDRDEISRTSVIENIQMECFVKQGPFVLRRKENLMRKPSLSLSIYRMAIGGVCLFSASTFAANFSVNSVDDLVDADLSDGLCATSTGVCTLRAAIQQANALAGEDRVLIPAGEYLLEATPTGEDEALTGDLDITDDLIIEGAGVNDTTVNGIRNDRVFDLIAPESSSIEVTFSRFTIREGIAPDPQVGGCVRNNGAALNINEIRFETCHGLEGGGVYQYAGHDLPMNFVNVSFDDTEASNGASIYSTGVLNLDGGLFIRGTSYAFYGSAIYAEGSEIFLSNAQFVQNQTGGDGSVYINAIAPSGTTAQFDRLTFDRSSGSGRGGALVLNGEAAPLNATVTDTDFLGGLSLGSNNAIQGGGIDSRQAELIVRESLFSGIQVSEAGGAIRAVGGEVKVFDSRFESNLANTVGGAIAAINTRLQVERSTFTLNQSVEAGAAVWTQGTTPVIFAQNAVFENMAGTVGGGVYTASPIAIENVSFFENEATQGAGVYAASQSVDLTHVSFDDNSAEAGSHIFNEAADVSLALSLLHGSEGSHCAGTITPRFVNFSSDDTCGFEATDAALLAVIDQRVENAIAMDISSVATNAGGTEGCLPNDQRGLLRSDGHCDVGAFEVDAVTPSAGAIQFVDNFMSLLEPSVDGILTIPLERIGGSYGEVDARIVLNPDVGTAENGVHYQWRDQFLTWEDGDSTVKLVQVMVFADEEYDGVHNFQLDIEEVTGYGTTGQNASVGIDLVDNVPPTPHPQPTPLPPEPPVVIVEQPIINNTGGGGSASPLGGLVMLLGLVWMRRRSS